MVKDLLWFNDHNCTYKGNNIHINLDTGHLISNGNYHFLRYLVWHEKAIFGRES